MSDDQQLEQIAKKLTELESEVSKKMWVQYTSGYDFGVAESQSKLNEFKKDKNAYLVVKKNYLNRKAKILNLEMMSFHQSEKINQLIEKENKLVNILSDCLNKFRPEYKNQTLTTTQLELILKEEKNSSIRRDVYCSRSKLNKILIDHGFVDLIQIRNDIAVNSGFENYIAYKLNQQDLDIHLFQEWPKSIEKFKPSFLKEMSLLSNQVLQKDHCSPWDKNFLKNQLSGQKTEVDLTDFFKVMNEVFKAYGFDLNNHNITFDIFPRKNKSEWGYNFPIETGKDSRVLANISNQLNDYWVLLHEAAHGIHFMSLNSEEYAFNRGVSGIVSEGFANFFGNLTYSEKFLSQFFKDEILKQKVFQSSRVQRLSELDNFSFVGDILFDHELYKQPIKSLDDINKIYLKTHKQVTDVDYEGSEPPWGRLIHHTTHPIYLHNYLLGDVLSAQVKYSFEQATKLNSHVNLKEFGEFWWQEVLKPSGRYSLQDLVTKFSGESLNLNRYFENMFYKEK